MGCTLPFAEMFFAEKKFRNEGSLTSPFAEIIFAKKQVAELGDILPRTFADIFCNIVFDAIPLKLNSKGCQVEEACISLYTCLCRTLSVRFLILSNFFSHR